MCYAVCKLASEPDIKQKLLAAGLRADMERLSGHESAAVRGAAAEALQVL